MADVCMCCNTHVCSAVVANIGVRGRDVHKRERTHIIKEDSALKLLNEKLLIHDFYLFILAFGSYVLQLFFVSPISTAILHWIALSTHIFFRLGVFIRHCLFI